MSTDNYRFVESDSLLCYHGPMLYEAKCLKRRKSTDGKAQYFIHYKGWNSKWEEWVDDDRVLAVNTVNMNKMASLKAQHSNSKKGGAKRSVTIVKEETVRNTTPPATKGKKPSKPETPKQTQSPSVSSPASPKLKKRGRPPKPSEAIKSEDGKENTEKNFFAVPAPVSSANKTAPKLDIPIIIKRRIAFDWNMINTFNRMLKCPSQFTVTQLIDDYIKSKQNSKCVYRNRAYNTGLSILQYFNALVNQQLLYPVERENDMHVKVVSLLSEIEKPDKKKYQEMMSDQEFWCSVYGPTYLLRLIVKLPNILEFRYNAKQILIIVANYHDLFKFIEDNFSTYFSNDDYELRNVASKT
ncbi:mortality factor 4-like protein 1 [Adelges cooleyi]|uniref:mortality factor 4-like protein 1 n=1 Tax=Adelges cooleyi TaxID=133065 RepID=UPI0021803E6F|nr:mortality factor 4-like protein 1 [Adelges cooleyi]